MDKLIELRKKNNLTQEALAKKLYVSRQTISKWELGITKPNIEQAEELAKVFNISVNELLREEEIKKSNKKYILLLILLFILTLSIIFIILNINNKKNNNIEVKELSSVTILNTPNEVEASKMIKNNIVKVINQIDKKNNIIGTGFFIKEGYLITNSHIVDIFGDITVEYNNGVKRKAYLYSNTIEHDIAILKVEEELVNSLTFGNSNDIEVTNDVLSAGYIYNFLGEASISKGTLSAIREVNGITFLQSDISIDTGSSGGPLFNDLGEVIGINTYTTKGKNFALSISSKSLQTIIKVLLDNPTIQYLDGERPKNMINKALVEVGYTDNIDLDLFNDSNIIEVSSNKNSEELKKLEKNNNVVITNKKSIKREKLECDDEYTLIDNVCVKETHYNADFEYIDCKDGYVLEGDMCVKNTLASPIGIKKECDKDYKLNSNDKCEKEGYVQTDGSFETRIGSCPKDKECYELNNDNYNIEFVSEITCPSKSSLASITSNIKYVWDNEEFIPSNYKTYNSITNTNGYFKKIDLDNMTYYEIKHYYAYNCITNERIDDNNNKVYTFLNYDKLKNIACKEGVLTPFRVNNKIQGFYCKMDINTKKYVYDVSCTGNDSQIYVDRESNKVICRRIGKLVEEPREVVICNDGYQYDYDKHICIKVEEYQREYKYTCNEGDTLYGVHACIKFEKKEPKKVEKIVGEY